MTTGRAPGDTPLPFTSREDAARRLARALAHHRASRPLVLAIPRGAVPMGRIIADELGGELDVVLVRKIASEDNPEFALGAVDEAGELWWAPHARALAATPRALATVIARERACLARRRERYRALREAIDPRDRVVVVVDDGLATGATMVAALRAARARAPRWLVCAVPVAAAASLEAVGALCDEVICLATPDPFPSVGSFYRRFDPVDDLEVEATLATGGRPARRPPAPGEPGGA